MTAGQVSLESLAAVMLMLVFLVAVVASALEIQMFGGFVSGVGRDQGQCSRIAELVQGVFVSGRGTRMVIEVPLAVEVSNSSVRVNEAYCYFSGIAQPAALEKGSVVILNESGVVSLANE